MAVGDAYVFPGFLTRVLPQFFFLKPPTTFLTCFYRGERRKYAGKKKCLNRRSNSQPPGHESDTLTTGAHKVIEVLQIGAVMLKVFYSSMVLHTYINPHAVNLKTFHVLFNSRVIDELSQNIDSSINNGSFTIYRFIRNPTDIQHYLKVLPKKWRTHLAKFRLSSHQLRIETGRYGKNRVTKAKFEDEYHFLLVCPAYVDLRAAHIKKYFYKRPNMFKFVKLLNSKKRNSLLNLAKFIKQSFSRRSEIINNSIE